MASRIILVLLLLLLVVVVCGLRRDNVAEIQICVSFGHILETDAPKVGHSCHMLPRPVTTTTTIVIVSEVEFGVGGRRNAPHLLTAIVAAVHRLHVVTACHYVLLMLLLVGCTQLFQIHFASPTSSRLILGGVLHVRSRVFVLGDSALAHLMHLHLLFIVDHI